uniref:Uncharacterized protein n=1 Tax=Chelonoidis abingdonii TaxID=106734 RepID=A0A8C0J2Q9_CHEAB
MDKLPDFAYLPSKYPVFKQHEQINLSGRVCINVKNLEFGLAIDTSLERLILTVFLGVNFIHWVEDLIEHDADKNTKLSLMGNFT